MRAQGDDVLSEKNPYRTARRRPMRFWKMWNRFLNSEGNIMSGDSINFEQVHVDGTDSVFTFSIYPFFYYKKNSSREYSDKKFLVNVSKIKGITEIMAIDPFNSDTIFKASLFPAEKVKFSRRPELQL